MADVFNYAVENWPQLIDRGAEVRFRIAVKEYGKDPEEDDEEDERLNPDDV